MKIERITTERELIDVRTDEGHFILAPKWWLLDAGVCATIESPRPLREVRVLVPLNNDSEGPMETVKVSDAVTAKEHPLLIALARRYFARKPLPEDLTEDEARSELAEGIEGAFRPLR
jgi:hypothetical protein